MEQKQLHLAPQALPEKRKLHNSHLLHCRHWRDALRVGIRESYLIHTQDDLADELGIGRSHFNQILNRSSAPKYFDFDRLNELQTLLGNTAISQFFSLESDGVLVHQNEPTVEEKAAAYDRLVNG